MQDAHFTNVLGVPPATPAPEAGILTRSAATFPACVNPKADALLCRAVG
jgi:hypothetical protein